MATGGDNVAPPSMPCIQRQIHTVGKSGSPTSPFTVSRKSLLFLCLSVASVVFFATNAETAFGAFVEVPIQISGTDTVTFTCPDAGNITYYSDYAGTYPTTGSPVANGTGSTVCSAISNGNSHLEGGWLNEAAITPDGEYWMYFLMNGISTTEYYFKATRSGGVWTENYTSITDIYTTGFHSSYNTRFTDFDITGTSTIGLDAQFYLDGSEIDVTQSTKNPAWIKFWYSDRVASTSVFEKINKPISVVAGTSTASTTLTGLADGIYDILIGFSNFGCSTGLSECPFPDAYVYSSFTIVGGVLTATGTPEFYDMRTASTTSAFAYHECGITDIGGCIINAGLFLIVPSNFSVESFGESFTELQTTFPFIYAFQANTYINTLFTATSTDAGIVASTTLGTITFVNRDMLEAVPYSGTFRTIIGYTMWLTFLWGAYRVVLRMFNPTTV